MENPFFSIIIPVYNGEETIGRCLESIYDSKYKAFETIVVDDGSTDNSEKIARRFPCQVVRLDSNYGAAIARNKGAKIARSQILLFLDADVLIKKNGLDLIVDSFRNNPQIAAVQGVYDKKSETRNLPSLYKHYYNCYKFSKVSEKFLSSTSTFCLAIKKEIFWKVGGFDGNFPPHSATEDVNLGLRLKELGYPILLDRNLKVIHLKSYTLGSLLKTEFIKVTSNMKLMLRSKTFSDYPISKNRKRDVLNVIFSVSLSLLILASFLSIFLVPSWVSIGALITLSAIYIGLNYKLFNLIRKEKGVIVTLGCLPISYLDMLTAQIALIVSFIDFKLLNRRY